MRRSVGLVALTFGAGVAGCEAPASAPQTAGFSVAGAYSITWGFLMASRGTLVTPSFPFTFDSIHGTINCLGALQITQQDNGRISGTFRVSLAQPDCVSQRPDFCASPGVASFCRDASGTLSGTVMTGLLPQSFFAEILSFSSSSGNSTAEALTGCRVVAVRTPQSGFASFLQSSDLLAVSGEVMTATVDCPSSTGLGLVDVDILFRGVRTSGP
ncbi:MAG TPA: hypothetical protein VH539_16300 [Gemmatimonadaceae bacterium]